MRVLVFGNPIAKADSAAVRIAGRLSGKMAGIEFVRFDTSEDLEKEGSEPIILDAVMGLEKPRIIELPELELSARPLSLHGFDLLWTLLLLKKLGKIRGAKIIGVPAKRSAKESLPEVRRLLLSILR